MMQMPAAAKVIADLVMGREPRIPIDQVRMERYL
jgi:glycine/D-amino acid oxidase-like deaminating enzyme